jgi:tRNA pseudouridine32 synthase/23S rRNA pseudouridine746 synthase
MVNDPCFHVFDPQPLPSELPIRFTFPFQYTPHPISRRVCSELQQQLINGTLPYSFGLDNSELRQSVGKMFGVLVVQRSDGIIGYLKAFSGKMGDTNFIAGFVPPVFDTLKPEGVFKQGEHAITVLNDQITTLENSLEYRALIDELNQLKQKAQEEQNQVKEIYRNGKMQRSSKRIEIRLLPNAHDLAEALNRESKKQQADYKQVVRKWRTILEEHSLKLEAYSVAIEKLKQQRKVQSAALQEWLFGQYNFRSSLGNQKHLRSIFYPIDPPAGAGECAAPKLLQYAFLNQYKPLCMAEFWWGRPPLNELRVHKYFYPACRGKCKPILDFMLEGVDMEVNPLAQAKGGSDLNVLFEDDAILIINKPAGLLSIPGKLGQESVQSLVEKILPNASGPHIVHRLDEATSGVMMIAKNEQVYHHLQNQFISRDIKKRYVALVEGTPTNNKGMIRIPLRPDIYERPRQLVCFDQGKDSITLWEKSGLTKDNVTRINFFPHTGRTHQLRVHAAHHLGLGTPIRGDELYGTPSDRLYLHAAEIQFTHPTTGKKMRFISEPEF